MSNTNNSSIGTDIGLLSFLGDALEDEEQRERDRILLAAYITSRVEESKSVMMGEFNSQCSELRMKVAEMSHEIDRLKGIIALMG